MNVTLEEVQGARGPHSKQTYFSLERQERYLKRNDVYAETWRGKQMFDVEETVGAKAWIKRAWFSWRNEGNFIWLKQDKE